jgi:hypothetical protein
MAKTNNPIDKFFAKYDTMKNQAICTLADLMKKREGDFILRSTGLTEDAEDVTITKVWMRGRCLVVTMTINDQERDATLPINVLTTGTIIGMIEDIIYD